MITEDQVSIIIKRYGREIAYWEDRRQKEVKRCEQNLQRLRRSQDDLVTQLMKKEGCFWRSITERAKMYLRRLR